MGRKSIAQQLAAKYQFRSGYRGPRSLGADLVHGELVRIKESHGDLTARAVVDESAPPEAVLHPVFEWDDARAADEFRLYQARHLIKAVQVVPMPAPEVAGQQARAAAEPASTWVHVPTKVGKEGVYVEVSDVVNNPDQFARALSELAARLSAARRALDALRAAAAELPEEQADRLAKISIAMQALQTADNAVKALH